MGEEERARGSTEDACVRTPEGRRGATTARHDATELRRERGGTERGGERWRRPRRQKEMVREQGERRSERAMGGKGAGGAERERGEAGWDWSRHLLGFNRVSPFHEMSDADEKGRLPQTQGPSRHPGPYVIDPFTQTRSKNENNRIRRRTVKREGKNLLVE